MKVIGGGEFNGVMDCDHGKRFCRFASIRNSDLIVVIGNGDLFVYSGHE